MTKCWVVHLSKHTNMFINIYVYIHINIYTVYRERRQGKGRQSGTCPELLLIAVCSLSKACSAESAPSSKSTFALSKSLKSRSEERSCFALRLERRRKNSWKTRPRQDYFACISMHQILNLF